MHGIVRRGIARTFQNVELFKTMTVLENVLVGAHTRGRDARRRGAEVLDYVGLGAIAPAPGRRAAVRDAEARRARARARLAPELLLLDEPAGGLNHEEVEELGRFIRQIRDDFELTVLLVEHHMNLVMGVSDHVHVLNFGRQIAAGTPAEVQREPGRDRGLPRHGRRAAADDGEDRWRCSSCATSRRATGGARAARRLARGRRGQIVAVLGANGAGKTTTLRAISGTVRRSGEIVFDGRRSAGAGPEAVAKLGIAHVPEGRGTFAELTVEENLRLGAYTRRGSVDGDIERMSGSSRGSSERRDQHAGTLSGGEQQMLALARALMSRPRLLLLDEPSLGLAPLVTREIFRIVRELNEEDGLTVLVVEQNAAIALEVAAHAYVLEVGASPCRGTSEELARDESVRKPTSGTDGRASSSRSSPGSRRAAIYAASHSRSC